MGFDEIGESMSLLVAKKPPQPLDVRGESRGFGAPAMRTGQSNGSVSCAIYIYANIQGALYENHTMINPSISVIIFLV